MKFRIETAIEQVTAEANALIDRNKTLELAVDAARLLIEERTRERDGMRGERDSEREIAIGWERKYGEACEQAISVRQRDGIDGVVCLICDAWANADYNLIHVPRCALSGGKP